MGHGGVHCQPPVISCIGKQRLYLSLILAVIHHHGDVSFVWKRYIDNTFTALPQDQVDRFLDHLNTVEPTINSTVEKESIGSLSTSVYRNKPHTYRKLDYTSHHPLAHKVTCGKNLDDPGQQELHICARQRQGEAAHCQGPEQQQALLTACESELVAKIQPLPQLIRGPTKNHYSEYHILGTSLSLSVGS